MFSLSQTLSIVCHKSALSGAHGVYSDCLKCCVLYVCSHCLKCCVLYVCSHCLKCCILYVCSHCLKCCILHVCSYCLKCCILFVTEELWQASGVGDGEGPPLVNPSAQEAKCAGKSCRGPAMILPWSCLLLIPLFDMHKTMHELGPPMTWSTPG